ncbi:MAG: phage tail tape measure protein, partial [Actinomycetia bacterium]|nr:phage tail tape measure protein [Actinomycetes bacterium]
MAGSGGGTRKLTVTVAGDATQMAKAFGKAADDAKGFGEKIKTSLSGPALKAGIAAAAAALGVIAVDGFMRGMDDEAASDKVAAQLVPGEQDMAVLGRVAGEVYAGAWGDSLAEVQSAVAELMKAGVEEVDLGNLTQQVLDISEAFDQDFAEVIRTAQTMVNNGLVPDMESAFDVITRGFQNVGQVGRDELLESLNEYSETFKTLGIDGPTAIGLIDAAIDAGAWSVDKVGDTLKEFSTRVVDGSDGTVAALEALGLNADEVARKITEGGPVAAEALGEVVRALGEVDEEAQNDIGVALFGAMWEDVGKDVVLSLDPAKVAVGDLSSATEDMGSVLNNNLATDVEAFKRVAMQGISDGIYKIAMPAIDAIRDAWADDGFSGVAELAAEKMKDAIKALGEWLKADGAKLIAEFLFVTLPVEIAQAFVAIQKAFLTLTWDALKAMGSGLASGAADHVWPWLKALPGEIV